MTTIVEEHEGDLVDAPPPDFEQLLDLSEGAFGAGDEALFGNAVSTDPARLGYCPDHPGDDTNCWCNSFMGEWDIPQPATEAPSGLEEPDYSRTESFEYGPSVPFKDDAPGSSKRNGIRFPRHAVKTLRDWLDAHADNPYPTEEEKVKLERQTELKPSQIANWLANARRRRKATEKAKPRLASSPSLRPTTAAIDIPTPDKPWDELNPFERWKNSPPEHEPANITDIANAVANTDFPEDPVSRSPSTNGRSSKRRKASSNGSGFSNVRAPSTTSLETGQTSSLSASSAAFSASNDSSHSTHGSFGSFSSSLAGKKDRRRRRRPAPAAARKSLTDDKKRIFQCTFCTDTFKSKYDWTRHEKSLHLSLEKWICAPLGPVITDQESGEKKCVYCDLYNPSSDHIESHNHRQCEDKGIDARTFYRKDHLRQHLRLMHGCEMSPAMESWKSIAVNINSRCGFCAQRFTVWQERVDHLTAHFKAGDRMSSWKGCRGLDPAVAAQVTNAMPPYLIGIEAASPNPFSATNRASWRQAPDFGSQECKGKHDEWDATCWEVLTVRLGKYAKEMADKGCVLSDDDLQRQARMILYDSDDAWNQTAADNLEWLDLFKKAHGLDFIPTAIGGQGPQIPEDLETYTDLGLRIPFSVQLQAYNQNQTGKHVVDAATRPGPYQKAKENLKEVYTLLATEGVLYNGDQSCPHTKCSENLMDISKVDGGSSPGSRLRRWCNEKLSTDAAEKLTTLRTLEAMKPNSNPAATATENRHRALATLWDLEAIAHEHTGSCSSMFDMQAAANARARALTTLDNQEKQHTSCAWQKSDIQLSNARARSQGLEALSHAECTSSERRAQGLEALSRAEAPLTTPDLVGRKWPGYLPRHKYELPKDRARLFATTTPAWEDAGMMPAPVRTTLPEISEVPATTATSTGAMMEFLGGDVGAHLPFSTDALTSQIPLPDYNTAETDWQLPDGGTVSHEDMMDLIKATSGEAEQTFDPVMADLDMDWTGGMEEGMGAMEGVNFDELTFDGVFDMPIDETFGGNV
ncbi:hypothetical protein PRZ48_005033 [Zasmidium cellare]|uniref:Uncharacterized protein n=1 Tax=Zasmidium cellare TaxID=395010 RepID=A0ABR0ESP5_ZASCE|nr:hypothetical protein PRZ48_005033 [Zasmidium cellare]